MGSWKLRFQSKIRQEILIFNLKEQSVVFLGAYYVLSTSERKMFSIIRKVLLLENSLKSQSYGFAFGQDSEMEHPPVSEKRLSWGTIWHPLQNARSLAQVCL